MANATITDSIDFLKTITVFKEPIKHILLTFFTIYFIMKLKKSGGGNYDK